MTTHRTTAADISRLLGLETPPVALAFVTEAPSTVPQTAQLSPASCAFWRHAESGVFYASAAQHFHCQIGAMVMGFDLPPQVVREVGALVEGMSGCGYLSQEESGSIPSVGGGAVGVLYGPLADFPRTPDAVLFWLTPTQAMVYNEAAGAAQWASTPHRVGGRPGCAALPMAIQAERPSLSFGCTGMRTFTEVADDRMLAVVPGTRLDGFLHDLRVIVTANEAMEAYYVQRKAELTAS